MTIEALETLIENYQYKLYRYCYQMVRSKESAEDITQEVFITYYSLNHEKNDYRASYLYAIAHNKCIDYLRKSKRKRCIYLYKQEQMEPSAEDEALKSALPSYLEDILRGLSFYERSVLLLRAVHEFSYTEIAHMLGKKEPTIRKQFNRVRSKVQHLLREGDNSPYEKICNI